MKFVFKYFICIDLTEQSNSLILLCFLQIVKLKHVIHLKNNGSLKEVINKILQIILFQIKID